MKAAGNNCVRVEITGRVQGVGYRYWMLQFAEKFGVTGWVRNRYCGDVEAVICGNPESVHLLLTACEKGPSFANVVSVTVVEELDEQFTRFESRRTI